MIVLNLQDRQFEPDFWQVIKMFYPTPEDFDVTVDIDYSRQENTVKSKVTITDKTTAVKEESGEITKFQSEKSFLKNSLYSALSEHLNINLPWGSLTGVRPTKLAYDLMNAGVKKVSLVNHLKKYYFVSEKKAELVLEIIQNQHPIEQNENLVDFYVNIPFCTSRCSYCSFVSAEIGKNSCLVKPYTDALLKEIEEAKKLISERHLIVKSVYFGGGTPTALPKSELERILSAVAFNTKEYTVEAGRPDTITAEILDLLAKYGVLRISINPQTFNDEVLKAIGRNHSSEQTLEAYKLARKYKFHINMDLIAGLPKDTLKSFKESVDICTHLNPENITVHTLTLKRGSNFAIKKENIFKKPLTEKMLEYSHSEITKNGYLPYYLYRQKNMVGNLENIGYCKPDTKCRFNIDSMEEKVSILACGANAVSKRIFLSEKLIKRQANVKDIQTYIEKINQMIEEKRELFS